MSFVRLGWLACGVVWRSWASIVGRGQGRPVVDTFDAISSLLYLHISYRMFTQKKYLIAIFLLLFVRCFFAV